MIAYSRSLIDCTRTTISPNEFGRGAGQAESELLRLHASAYDDKVSTTTKW